MPLLMCPNCNSGMKEINRESIQIDMCPSCHGVWLDRGELQKLLETTQEQPLAPAPTHTPYPQPHYPPQHRSYEDKHHQGYYRKKSKLESIFDIFD